MAQTLKMQHDMDPKQLIMDAVGDLSKFTLFGNQILVGIYKRPDKTKSGIILADQTRQEDEFQGKSALVLAKGPTAFVSDSNYDFAGQNVEIGDWVAIFVSDGRKIMINGQLCRIVEDQHIRLRIPAPDVVY